jgi:hypothetical protein
MREDFVLPIDTIVTKVRDNILAFGPLKK